MLNKLLSIYDLTLFYGEVYILGHSVLFDDQVYLQFCDPCIPGYPPDEKPGKGVPKPHAGAGEY
jgi:hypothetical protein